MHHKAVIYRQINYKYLCVCSKMDKYVSLVVTKSLLMGIAYPSHLCYLCAQMK